MASVSVFAAILGAMLLGAMSPGPSFVLVSRTAITGSRCQGLASALGMSVGATVLSAFALAGLTALLQQVPTIYLGARIAGGLYLIYLGFRMWRKASVPLSLTQDTVRPGSAGRAFGAALATQLSNPKTVIVQGSVFAALLPSSSPTWFMVALLPAIFVIETAWYACVALVFSASRPRAFYLDFKHWIDRAAGAVMAGLGLRLIIEAVRTR